MNARSEEIASALPPDLETLPRLGGFRLRGIATTRSESQVRTLFGVFALGFTAIALEMVLLNFRAWQLREPLRLNARERALTFREVTRLVFQCVSDSFHWCWCYPCHERKSTGAVGFISL